jgi:organic radical activating enzyme
MPVGVPVLLNYRIAEVLMFDTCTHRCGYCWLAESGRVLDFDQLDPFRSAEWIKKVAEFFNSRTDADHKWLVQLTGGEPLIAPNLDLLCRTLFRAGNRAAFYTALMVGENHPGFRVLRESSPQEIDYIMASFHPEAELHEEKYFEKIRILKDAGHKVFLRFVGHPARLHRLDELSARCREMDVCFYPTTLLSNNYPAAYSPDERASLTRHFSSLSQHIQLAGGVDTTNVRCHAGSRLVSINLQTGNITPCITVESPSLGNIFENRLELGDGPLKCPVPGIDCICDVHFQQDVVIGAEDSARFATQKNGFVLPVSGLDARLAEMRQTGMNFYKQQAVGIGNVADDSRLFYPIEEVRRAYRKRRRGVKIRAFLRRLSPYSRLP